MIINTKKIIQYRPDDNKQKMTICCLEDFLILVDHRVKIKESQKRYVFGPY